MSLTAARTGDDGALVVVDGPLDYHATEELAELLGGLLEDGAVRIAIDLVRATPIDDAAIGVLFRGLLGARDAGGSLAIGTPEERLRDALATMGVDRVLRVTESREGALAALGLTAPDGW
jgi:anti-anti-sigma factor